MQLDHFREAGGIWRKKLSEAEIFEPVVLYLKTGCELLSRDKSICYLIEIQNGFIFLATSRKLRPVHPLADSRRHGWTVWVRMAQDRPVWPVIWPSVADERKCCIW